MAIPALTVPQFPNVPNVSGVPQVLRQAGAVINTVVLLAADAKALLRAFSGPQWGIFTANGAPVLIGDSVVGVDFRREWRVSNYPMEAGAFASYDKVTEPYDVRVTFSNSGAGTMLSAFLSGGLIGSLITGSSPGVTNRRAFLTALDTAAASLDLFKVTTPECSYPDCSIVHYDFRRDSRKGATLIEIDVWLRQIRQVASKAFTNPPAVPASSPATPVTDPKNPAAADASSSGTVQASGSSGSSSEGTTYAYDQNGNPTQNSAEGEASYQRELQRAGITPENSAARAAAYKASP